MLAQCVVDSGVMPCAVLQFSLSPTKPVLNDRIERKVTAGAQRQRSFINLPNLQSTVNRLSDFLGKAPHAYEMAIRPLKMPAMSER